MSLLDKVIATVTPKPSDADIAAARSSLRALGSGVAWVTQVCDHHDQIDAAFAAVRGATSKAQQRAAQKQLATLLTGHSLAEEAALYPAMALHDQMAHAAAAFTQQSAAKVNLAALEELEPMSSDYLDKVDHLWAAVAYHVHQEESDWYPKLRDTGDAALQARLSLRYAEEVANYLDGQVGRTP